MIAFITGGEGFTGKHLKNFLQSKDIEIISYKGDILDYKRLDEELGQANFDFIIHLAGLASQEDNPVLCYETNVIGTENLLKAASKNCTNLSKILLASSALIYDAANCSPTNPISEKSSFRPQSHYAISKLSMEMIARNFEELPIQIVRPFNYSGESQSKKFFLGKIMDAINTNLDISLGYLGLFREMNDVRDISEWYFNLIRATDFFEPVNLCSGEFLSLNQILEMALKISGSKISISVEKDPHRSSSSLYFFGDPSLLFNKTCSIKRYSIEDTISSMISF